MISGMDAATPIGLKIKRAREKLRWSQAQLAEALGVSQKTIDNWEHNRRYPKSAIGALEDVLGVTFDDEPEPGRGSRSDDDAIEELRRGAAQMLEAAERMAAARDRQRRNPPNGKANGDETRRAG